MKQVSKQRIAKLQKIFKEEYGKELSFAEASRSCIELDPGVAKELREHVG